MGSFLKDRDWTSLVNKARSTLENVQQQVQAAIAAQTANNNNNNLESASNTAVARSSNSKQAGANNYLNDFYTFGSDGGFDYDLPSSTIKSSNNSYSPDKNLGNDYQDGNERLVAEQNEQIQKAAKEVWSGAQKLWKGYVVEPAKGVKIVNKLTSAVATSKSSSSSSTPKTSRPTSPKPVQQEQEEITAKDDTNTASLDPWITSDISHGEAETSAEKKKPRFSSEEQKRRRNYSRC